MQRAAIAAWNDDAHADRPARAATRPSASSCSSAFARRGWTVEASEATFYLWVRGARAATTWPFVERLMRAGHRRDSGLVPGRRAARATCAGRWCRRSSSAARRSRGSTRDSDREARAVTATVSRSSAGATTIARRLRTGARPLDEPAVRGAVEGAVAALDAGRSARGRARRGGDWITHGWLQQAIALYFRMRGLEHDRGRARSSSTTRSRSSAASRPPACASCRRASRATARSSSPA